MKTKVPTVQMERFRDDFIEVLCKHAGNLDSTEMLTVAAYTVGQLLAMMDSTRMTPAMGMELVAKNIEAGNQQAISDAGKWMGNA